MLEIVGIAGASLILLAWVLGLFDELRSRKNLIEIRFSMVTLLGTVILAYYSNSIGNMVFLFLNLGILCVVLFEVVYTVYLTRYKCSGGRK